jgi:hypothetical protein
VPKKTETTDAFADLTVVDKRVAALRAGFAKTEFELSAKPPEEWAERFGKAVDDSEDFASMRRNPGPALDGTKITWEIGEDEVELGWKVLKAALEEANSAYGKLDEARRAKEAKMEERLGAREDKRQALDKKLKALK